MASDATTQKPTEPSTQESEQKHYQLEIGGKVISEFGDDLATMRRKLKKHLVEQDAAKK